MVNLLLDLIYADLAQETTGWTIDRVSYGCHISI